MLAGRTMPARVGVGVKVEIGTRHVLPYVPRSEYDDRIAGVYATGGRTLHPACVPGRACARKWLAARTGCCPEWLCTLDLRARPETAVAHLVPKRGVSQAQACVAVAYMRLEP